MQNSNPRNGWLPAHYRSDRPLLRDLFFLALIIRLFAFLPVFWSFAVGQPPYLGGDWGAFHEWGKGILSGAGMLTDGHPTAEYTPLYPLFIAAVYWTAGGVPWVVLAVQALVGALACPLAAATARVFSRAVATENSLVVNRVTMAAGLLYALYPAFIKAETLVMTEALYVFWVTVTLWALARLETRFSAGGMALLGLAAALGSLTKPSLAIFPFACAGGLVIREWVRKRRFAGPWAKGLVLALVFAAVLSPWILRNYHIFGRLVPLGTEAGAVFYDGVHLKDGWKPGFRTQDGVTARAAKIESEPERSAFLMRAGLKKIAEEPGRVPWLLGVKAAFFWSPFDWEIFLDGTYRFGFVFLIPFSVYALWGRGVAERARGFPKALALWPLWGIVVYFFLLGIVFIGSPRLRLPCETGILLLAAFGVVRYSEAVRRGIFWAVTGGWLGVNLLAFFFSDSLRALARTVF